MQLDDGRIRAVGKSENMVGDGGVEIEGHLIEKVFAYISTNFFSIDFLPLKITFLGLHLFISGFEASLTLL